MSKTNASEDAINAFLARGGNVKRLDPAERSMTEREIYLATRGRHEEARMQRGLDIEAGRIPPDEDYWIRQRRTASRILRLMRLRSTALPSAFGTVRPMRGPVVAERRSAGRAAWK